MEELLIAAHGHRTGRTGKASLGRATRQYLVEAPLQAPSGQKIERALFAAFGIELDVLPQAALFEARRKLVSNKGAGKGDRVPGPTTWSELKELLDAVVYVRNATAHGDVVKLSARPQTGEGIIWVGTADGSWSVQQPHCLSSLRTIVSVFNTVAYALDVELSLFGGTASLLTPASVVDYAVVT